MLHYLLGSLNQIQTNNLESVKDTLYGICQLLYIELLGTELRNAKSEQFDSIIFILTYSKSVTKINFGYIFT